MGSLCCKQTLDDDEQKITIRPICDNDIKGFHPDQFSLLQVIGEGAFGKVRIVRHKQTRRQFALKYIHKDKCIHQRATNHILSERRLLETIDHPLIVNLRYAFQDETNLYMALDLMLGGDLHSALQTEGPFSESRARFYIAQIALALNYLHQHRIAHRDIKPENILLDARGNAHVSDFNTAIQFDEKQTLQWSLAGSHAYMAPEALGRMGYSVSVDWWSLGVVAYELLFGKRPFKGVSTEDLTRQILHQPVLFPDHAYATVSPEGINGISQFLDKSPYHRLGCYASGFEQVLAHPWFADLDWIGLELKQVTPPYQPHCNKIPKRDTNDRLESDNDDLIQSRRQSKPRMTSFDAERPVTENAQWRQVMEEEFLDYDYTQFEKRERRISFQRVRRNSKTVIDKMRRLSLHYSQSKYRAQGYRIASAVEEPSAQITGMDSRNSSRRGLCAK
ncbi:kinase-like domain-containing protein [Radiomyces spectabilis]|uniref:kinase-like domain-containing protein n=1 Tax=Radiomyces spectabilis TaxID=64574 RepID=UPI002220EE8B|nr:kinase-like domain-containing protein [Radiomyces spectabilis]KAI8376229.1 kinase-like domain-containing protein [Radiomyces spectabilis]